MDKLNTSTQEYDIALYGHITLDKIFTGFKSQKTIGALGNVWDALILTDPSTSVDLVPTAIGEAIILVDEKNNTRTGRGRLNLQVANDIKISKAKWHHVMYLNQLQDASFINNIKSGIISADLTAGKMNNLDFLAKIDYLFISDEDLFMDITELAKKVKGWTILHYPGGSYTTNGTKSFLTENKIIKNVNVLGAGDMFAGSFIYKHLLTDSIQECVTYAHSNTKRILEIKKNEK